MVFDAVYTPAHTRLLAEAAAAGATPVSGMEMFVRQAEEQFEAFTGVAGGRGGGMDLGWTRAGAWMVAERRG